MQSKLSLSSLPQKRKSNAKGGGAVVGGGSLLTAANLSLSQLGARIDMHASVSASLSLDQLDPNQSSIQLQRPCSYQKTTHKAQTNQRQQALQVRRSPLSTPGIYWV